MVGVDEFMKFFMLLVHNTCEQRLPIISCRTLQNTKKYEVQIYGMGV